MLGPSPIWHPDNWSWQFTQRKSLSIKGNTNFVSQFLFSHSSKLQFNVWLLLFNTNTHFTICNVSFKKYLPIINAKIVSRVFSELVCVVGIIRTYWLYKTKQSKENTNLTFKNIHIIRTIKVLLILYVSLTTYL